MTGSVSSSQPAPEAAERVSTLELFFDLVFVFTITQLSTLLVHETSWRGVLQAVLMLGVRWNPDNPPMYEPPLIRKG